MMRVLHTGAPPSALTALRVLLFGLWFLKAAFDPIERLILLPSVLFIPPFPLNLLSDAAAGWFAGSFEALVSLRILTALFALLAASGLNIRWTGVPACLLLTVYQALVRSYGHLNHAELALLLSTYVFVGQAFIARTPRLREKQAEHTLITVTFLFCLTYTLVGAKRFAFGGLDVFLLPLMEGWSVNMASRVSYWDFGWGRYAAESALFAGMLRMGFVVGSIMELFAPFALVWRPFRLAFVAVMLPMHAAILMIMNIGFFENMAMFVLFMDMGIRRNQSSCIVLFDGVCHFCNRFVTFLQRRDAGQQLYFVASQSEAGKVLMQQYQISGEEVGRTIYAIEGSRAFSRSTAVLKIVSHLSAPWHFMTCLAVIPRALRDAVYRTISANRYRWFGMASECRIPTAEEKQQFLQTLEEVEAFRSSGDKTPLAGETLK
ncbi:MAG TPA: DCC1-like thiol-disulfide oxidoreductase family protein [Chthoniobacteraceae bacterium]|nr:DCC1-like thiol-disulfide oxidoreductase family protein [Chthoniobacteraceae bacterium]